MQGKAAISSRIVGSKLYKLLPGQTVLVLHELDESFPSLCPEILFKFKFELGCNSIPKISIFSSQELQAIKLWSALIASEVGLVF